MALWLLGLLAAAEALDCARYGLADFDSTHIATVILATPPSRTNKTVYFNPCGPVKGPKECAADDHFCAIERAEVGRKWQLTQVIPIGSPEANATEHFWFSSDGGYDEVENGSELHIRYEGAKWGDKTQDGLMSFHCGAEQHIELVSDDEEFFYPAFEWHVKVTTPTICEEGSVPDAPDEPAKSGGWGFFTWLFVLLLIGLVGYAALTVYVNYANAHGSVPTDLGDILRDLPYLIRDLLRRVSESLSSRRSGYSAI